VKVIGDQLIGLQTIPKLPKLIGVVTPYVNTNMNTSDITFMAKDFFSTNRGNIDTLRIPVEDSYSDARISGEGAVLDINVEKNKEALHQFIQQ
jgi:anionic cell wall polymer biosynthesis LytR-Cps2A-Psr (LCP) family protein